MRAPALDGDGAARLTRKDVLSLAAAGLVALAAPRRAGALLAAPEKGFATFESLPGLKVPTLTVSTSLAPAPGYVFVTTLNGPGQRGLLVFDNSGEPIWFRPLDQAALDFRRQTYRGKPVLTWWQGTISQIGVGEGVGKIVDQSYRHVAEVQAGNGYRMDVHEFLLTRRGTALITAYDRVQADLTSVGGPASGAVFDSIVQEVDVKTGRVVFEWRSLDHVPLADSYAPLADPFDYFHVNSVDEHLDGSLIVCARNTSAVYKIDRSSGAVQWRLGGPSSDFELGPRVFFMSQHDARAHPDGTLTIFDDGPSPSSEQSRAIRIALDVASMRALLVQEYVHPRPLEASAMGNAQLLADGRILVGWGTQPYVTEFGPLGDVRFDATFDGGAWNYRAFRDTWVGRPATRPAAVVRRHGRGHRLYASWNGSTETAYWRIDAGASRDGLQTARIVERTGFETVVPLAGRRVFVSVTALDASKRALGSSRVLHVT